MSTLETQYREYLRNSRGGFCSFEEWKEMHGNQIKQALIDMMKSDEELGLYDDTEINRIELVCKDCSDSLEDCTCIKSTIDFPRQEIKLEEVFNDEKKENIKKFIDEIQNPSEPNQALIDAAERYIAGDNYNRYYDDFPKQETLDEAAERIISDMGWIWENTESSARMVARHCAKWQQERSYSEEDVKNAFLDGWELRDGDLPFTKAKNEGFNEFKKK
jgi:hypothetical protein